MTPANFETMSLGELRQYVLVHRDDVNAFQLYVDRSKESGRMISINPNDSSWEQSLDSKLRQAREQ
jgi:hypothetical protein